MITLLQMSASTGASCIETHQELSLYKPQIAHPLKPDTRRIVTAVIQLGRGLT